MQLCVYIRMYLGMSCVYVTTHTGTHRFMYTHTHTHTRTHTQDSHELLRLRAELRDAQNLTQEWRVESFRQQSAYEQAEKERLEAQVNNNFLCKK
jgi:hypothetical protein